jgi:hypothetical protein
VADRLEKSCNQRNDKEWLKKRDIKVFVTHW